MSQPKPDPNASSLKSARKPTTQAVSQKKSADIFDTQTTFLQLLWGFLFLALLSYQNTLSI